MYIVGREEMQEMDRYTIETIGIPGAVLMENAGAHVANEVARILADNGPRESRIEVAETGNTDRIDRQMIDREAIDRQASIDVLILAGSGNNGGDGFVIARRLAERGYRVQLCLLVPEHKLKGDALVHYLAYVNNNFPVWLYDQDRTHVQDEDDNQTKWKAGDLGQLQHYIARSQVIVDALLGTGVKGQVRSPIDQVIRWVNEWYGQKKIIAVDIPSGVCSNTGQIGGVAIQATQTITFACPKKGFFLSPGSQYVGKWKAVDISIQPSLVHTLELDHLQLITPTLAKRSLPQRIRHGHKGTFGHVLVVGGSRNLVGAPLFSAKSALRSGAGLVTMAVPETIYRQVSTGLPEAMFFPLPDENGYIAKGSAQLLRSRWIDHDVVAIGPGLGRGEDLSTWLEALLSDSRASSPGERCGSFEPPLVLDADALYLLNDQKALLKQYKAPVVLTPHPGEMARLMETTVEEVESDRFEVARSFAQEYKVYLVLKGNHTVLASPTGELFINGVGNDALAKGGAGDVLTGMIAAMLAQGALPLEAMIAAVYIHGRTGEQLAETHSTYSVLPTDLIEHIGSSINELNSLEFLT